MAILKCKMCGGNLEFNPEETVCECEYCGSTQTIPKVDDEKKITLYERANRLRFNCEFDKAASVYESIVAEFHEEAEAYWGLVLCKYGIEYVDDPATGKKVPTCHRSSFDSVMDDADFELVMENADAIARKIYREEAKQIEEIRKGIIEVSGKEQPYDIFICYKETAEDGQRTIDSVLAQDVYEALTEKGYRVFFSRISLEDKLGIEYEPYIFAALNSAKIMLAFGTTYDYYNAVWVKNEWSRFLKLMTSDKSKHLIPCYKDIDAYDMPKEFARLQAQDLGKVGAVQDLLRGIEKIMYPEGRVEKQDAKSASVVDEESLRAAIASAVSNSTSSNVEALLQRGFLALEDEDFIKAEEFFEEALNLDAQCARAYLGKLIAELEVSKKEDLALVSDDYETSKNYQKIMRFGDDALKQELEGYLVQVKERIENQRLQKIEQEKAEKERQEQLLASIAKAIEAGEGNAEKEMLQGQINHCEQQIKALEREKVETESLQRRLPELEKQKSVLEQEVKELEYSIERLNTEKGSLGLFAGKRKKEIEYEIFELEGQLRVKQGNLFQIKNQCGGKSAGELSKQLEEIEKQKEKVTAEKTQKEQALMNLNNASVGTISYKDALEQLKNESVRKTFKDKYPEIIKKVKIIFVKKGDIIPFGHHPVCNEWIVLKREGNKILLIAKKALEQRKYNEKCEDVTWEKCTLRTWLNGIYLNSAFNNAEQKMIVNSSIENKNNSKYGTTGGNNTTDKVFLLSIDEVNTYFDSDSARKCTNTDGTSVFWWLRSPGSISEFAAHVSSDGSVDDDGDYVNNGYGPVRPALWIDISNL